MISHFFSKLYHPLFLHLFLLLIGYMIAGWLLAAFNAPLWVWWGTTLVIIHLAKSGVEALLIANGWIVFIMFLVTVLKPWPQIWPSHIPYKEITVWATTIMLLWLLAILLVVELALTHQKMKLRNLTTKQQFGILICWTGLALVGGRFIFYLKTI
jgi:hypothetical protein